MSSHTKRQRPRRRRVVATIPLALLVLLLPTLASARTQVDRFTIEEHIEDDPFLSEQCGTPVDVDVEINIIHHTFDADPARHRQEEDGTVAFSSDQGTVVERWRHAGPHEIVEVIEELEPEVFLVRVRAKANGRLWLENGDGERLLGDAGTVTFDDIAIWNRTTGQIGPVVESTVARVAGPHPLLDDATFLSKLCGELAP